MASLPIPVPAVMLPLTTSTQSSQPRLESIGESRSLTPRTARRTHATTDMRVILKEYEDEQSNRIERLAVNLPEVKGIIGERLFYESLHSIEEVLFQLAFEHLKSSCVVLVHVFARKLPKDAPKDSLCIVKDNDTQFPETHTICLWRQEPANNVVLIDPSSAKFTEDLMPILSKKFPNIKLSIMPHKNDKFYSPGLWVIGRDNFQARDCIDIAVKIALVIASGRNRSLKVEDITKSIMLLSNQNSVNTTYRPSDTIIRELQSSSFVTRENVQKNIKDNAKDLEAIAFNTISELNEVDAARLTSGSIFLDEPGKSRDFIKSLFGKVSVGKLRQFYTMLAQVEELNKRVPGINGFSGIKLGFIQDKSFIPKDENGYTALHVAAINNNIPDTIELVRKAKNNGSGQQILSEADPYGQTPLHWAVSKLHQKLTDILINAMEDEDILMKAEGNQNYTALHLAVHCINVEAVRKLLGKCGRPLAVATDAYGQTALHWAVDKHNAEMVEALVDVMALPDLLNIRKTDGNYTALHLAVHAGNLKAVEKLLAKGKRELAIATDASGRTALYWAAGKGLKEITQLLLQYMNARDVIDLRWTVENCTALHTAVHAGNSDIVRHLLENAEHELAVVTDIYGQTALHRAVYQPNLVIVEQLINAVTLRDLVDIRKTDGNYTVLHLAVDAGNREAVEKLLAKGKRELAIATDAAGRTALDSARSKGNSEIVRMLEPTEEASDIHLINNRSRSPGS